MKAQRFELRHCDGYDELTIHHTPERLGCIVRAPRIKVWRDGDKDTDSPSMSLSFTKTHTENLSDDHDCPTV